MYLCVSRSALSDSVARQVPLSMGFSRQEYWSGWPFPSSGDLPDPESEPGPPALQAGSPWSQPPPGLLFRKAEEQEARAAAWGCAAGWTRLTGSRKGQAACPRGCSLGRQHLSGCGLCAHLASISISYRLPRGEINPERFWTETSFLVDTRARYILLLLLLPSSFSHVRLCATP